MAEILVVGAGIVGVSTAIWLQRSGHDVTIVDRTGPAAGTSFGNAGVLAAGAFVPVTAPGLWKKAPGMLLNREAPLFLKWSYLPKLLPFLYKYLGYATQPHVEHYAQSMAQLLQDSLDQHRALSADTPAAQYVHDDDYCFGYTTRALFEADAMGWDVRARNNVPFDVIEGADYGKEDPLFADQFEVVVKCRNHGRISDPGAYVNALANHFEAEGGTLVLTEVQDMTMTEGAVTTLITDKGTMSADHIIIATGAWSKSLCAKLEMDVPLEAERGYHIELVNPSASPKNPMMIADKKFVLTPMKGRLRAAGVIEFGGLKAPASAAPLQLLKRQVSHLLPAVTYDRIEEWLGHRPATPDSLPVIGATDPSGQSYVGFGHQHVGLTGGPKTGRIIAGMINRTPSNLDMTPFDPAKYKK